MSSANTRATRSGSQSGVSHDELKRMIELVIEEKVVSRLEKIVSSIISLENRFDSIQSEQIRLGQELSHVKTIVGKQQIYIENLEKAKREANLIFVGIPEGQVTVDDESFMEDEDKLNFLCHELSNDFSDDDIISCSRLGRRNDRNKRLLLVKFSNIDMKNQILYSQKKVRENTKLKESFGIIHINKDSPPLTRLEEKRLYEKMKDMRRQLSSDDRTKLYIRKGQLFKDNEIVDGIDIENQLF